MSAGGGHGDGCSTSPPRSPSPFHLLEVTVISAQDLHRRRLGRRVRAYAAAWADHHQAHKLRTDVDRAGGASPTWNDRFLFRVDDAFLRSETAAVTVEVRSGARRLLAGADPVLGVARIVVSTFLQPAAGHGRQVAALMLRRPRSLRPQGVVNVAVSLLDDTRAARTVPLYDAPDSPDAFAVKDLAAHRPASSKIVDDGHDADDDDPKPPPFVDHSGRLDPRSAAVEQKKLVQTLEKWKADLSPSHREDGRRGAWRSFRRISCFGGSGHWDR
ncbi:hypothetical protein EJB05_19227, partial [Eragrostis curvula]